MVACSACGIITLRHYPGELPKLDILQGREVCDEKFRAKIKDNGDFLITCSVKT